MVQRERWAAVVEEVTSGPFHTTPQRLVDLAAAVRAITTQRVALELLGKVTLVVLAVQVVAVQVVAVQEVLGQMELTTLLPAREVQVLSSHLALGYFMQAEGPVVLIQTLPQH
jgi:fucose 4-O-acetylase-like acetyltransferase